MKSDKSKDNKGNQSVYLMMLELTRRKEGKGKLAR